MTTAAAPGASSAPATTPAPPASAEVKPGAAVEAKPPAEGAPAPKIHKVKVDGKEVDVPEDELHRNYSSFAAGQKALKEAAETKKAIEAEKTKLTDAIRKGDVKTLREAGFSDAEIEQLSVAYITDKQNRLMEEERRKGLTPEQQELERLRQDKATRDAEAQKTAEAKKQQEVQTVKAKVTKSVIDTLELFPEQLRRNDFLASRVFDAWAYAFENDEKIKAAGIEVTPQFIADKVRADFRALAREAMGAAGDEELDQFVPDSAAEKLFARRQKKAQEEAHPELTQQSHVREPGQKKADEKPRLTAAKLMRRSYFSNR